MLNAAVAYYLISNSFSDANGNYTSATASIGVPYVVYYP